MKPRSSLTRAVALLAVLSTLPACASSHYTPAIAARGELIVIQRRGPRIYAAGEEIGRSPTFSRLPDYVRCVPDAEVHAVQARRAGRAARAFSILGATFGLGAFMGFAALADRDHAAGWLIGAIGSGITGFGFSLAGFRDKRQANGHALDAVNFYNDAVGSLGATCSDLVYPPPAGPIDDSGAVILPDQ